MARRASSRQRGAAYLQEREGRKTEPSPRFVIPSPARAWRGAASDGRVRDLLSGRELAGTSSMARRASSRLRGTACLQEGGGGDGTEP